MAAGWLTSVHATVPVFGFGLIEPDIGTAAFHAASTCRISLG